MKGDHTQSRWSESSILWCSLIVVGVGIAYANSLSGQFVFDDVVSIPNNPSIQHFGSALFPPHGSGQTVEARPILNLSLALNYALGGYSVTSYHLLNIAIHALAGLCLFGLIGRTLKLPPLEKRFGQDASWIAGSIALLWSVHPLQTESVTYIIQRAESLTGLFVLASLYALARSADSPKPALWRGLSVVCVFVGFGIKELMIVSLPLLYLFDALFLSDSFSGPLRRHKRYYVGLLSSLVVLVAVLVSSGGNRSGSIGLGIGVSPWSYLLTQVPAILTYLKLSVYRSPLIFEYGTFWVDHVQSILPGAIFIFILLGLSAYAIFKRIPSGFLGAWFFITLAPTSLVPGTTQMIVEHRMYLPLVAIVAGLVLCFYQFTSRGLLWVWLAVCVLAVLATRERNNDYRSELALWSDTVSKEPSNARAQNNLGVLLLRSGDTMGALSHYKEAIRLDPNYAEAENNYGIALVQFGKPELAIAHYQAALRLRPNAPETHTNYAVALIRTGNPQAAVDELKTALVENPSYAEAHNGLGVVLASLGQYQRAKDEYKAALRLRPQDSQTHNNLGNAEARLGEMSEAIAEYVQAIKLDPSNSDADNNIGVAYASQGNLSGAVAFYQEAVRLNPSFAEAHNNLGTALAQLGRVSDALSEFETAVRLSPGFTAARNNLAIAKQQLGLAP